MAHFPISQALNILTPKEVAELLKIHPNTLANWRMKKKGPPAIKIHGRYRYPAAKVQQWLQNNPKNAND